MRLGRIRSLLLGLLLITTVFGQEKPAYTIYNAKGRKVSYGKMIKALAKSDIILFGEQHNNPVTHWLQYEVTATLHVFRSLILGAEMFEADGQTALNDYLEKRIKMKTLDTLVRLWPNYKTDYAPLVEFAKAHRIPFIATNIPRRYARLVHRNGLDVLSTLSAEEKNWVAPLPIAFDPNLMTYKAMAENMKDHGNPTRLVMAQAIKDATMAHFILKNYKKGQVFLHFNGAYHSDSYQGIVWYLKRERKEIIYTTITTVSQEETRRLAPEYYNIADFIICVDSHMTRTY